MIGKSMQNQTALTNNEAKDILEKIEKEYIAKDKPIGYELEQSIKYLKKYGNVKNAEKIKKELMALDIPENIAVELANCKPNNEELIKTILLRRIKIDEKIIPQISDILNKR